MDEKISKFLSESLPSDILKSYLEAQTGIDNPIGYLSPGLEDHITNGIQRALDELNYGGFKLMGGSNIRSTN